MEHFLRNVWAGVVAYIVTWTICGIGALLLGFVTALSQSLTVWQQGSLIFLFALVVIWAAIATYLSSKQRPAANSNDLDKLKADCETLSAKLQTEEAKSARAKADLEATIGRIRELFVESLDKATLDLETLKEMPEGKQVTHPASDSWMTQLEPFEVLGRSIRERIRFLCLLGPELGLDVKFLHGLAKIEMLNAFHKLQREV